MKERTLTPINTVTVVMLDRATQWITGYPKASRTAEHTIEAFKYLAGPTDKIASRNLSRVQMERCCRHHRTATD